MQIGPYITNRWMVGMIQDICRQRGISFRTFSDDWALELEKDGVTRRVIGYQFDLNNAAAAQIALDKVAAYQILALQNIPAVPHFLLRTKAGDAQWQVVDWAKGVVVKPLLGTGGHGIGIYKDEQAAKEATHASGIEAWAASPLYLAKREVRIILLDDINLLAYEKQPVVQDTLKIFNLGKGATPLPHQPSDDVLELARRAKNAIGLRLCAVDIFELETGEWKVLEVNSGVMMENYARISEENRQKTAALYERVIGTLFP